MECRLSIFDLSTVYVLDNDSKRKNYMTSDLNFDV